MKLALDARSPLPMVVGVVAALATAPTRAASTAPEGEDLAAVCSRLGTDDTIRLYAPSLRDRTTRAFLKTAPDAKPDESAWPSQAQYRCFQGKVLVCFIGANLPCVKLNTARDNKSAAAFCRGASNRAMIPAAVQGHDSAYSFRCRDGDAVIDHATWHLDQRGFASELWTVLPDR